MTTGNSSAFSLLKTSYAAAIGSVMKSPRIYLPFMVFALIEMAALVFVYLIPREPLRVVMGPVVTTFWGENFLHYPQNFLLLPKLSGFARMALLVFIGSLTTGIAVALFYKKSLSSVWGKYIHLFIVIFIVMAGFYYVNRMVFQFLTDYFKAGNAKFLFVGPRWWLGAFSPVISQILALILQAIFAYAIPIIILTEKKFFSAIAGSFVFAMRNFGLTLLLVFLPMLITVPLSFLNYHGNYLMGTIAPEVILWLGFIGIVVNSMIVDPLMTLTMAAFYQEKKGIK